MDKFVNKYNTTIQSILQTISNDLTPDVVDQKLIDTINRRFRVALTCDRTYIIEETSPELLEYRDMIANENWDELIYKNWEEEIEKQQDQMMYEVDNNSLRDMVKLLRKIWEGYDVEQQQLMKKKFKKMLSYCIQYHKAKLESQQ